MVITIQSTPVVAVISGTPEQNYTPTYTNFDQRSFFLGVLGKYHALAAEYTVEPVVITRQ